MIALALHYILNINITLLSAVVSPKSEWGYLLDSWYFHRLWLTVNISCFLSCFGFATLFGETYPIGLQVETILSVIVETRCFLLHIPGSQSSGRENELQQKWEKCCPQAPTMSVQCNHFNMAYPFRSRFQEQTWVAADSQLTWLYRANPLQPLLHHWQKKGEENRKYNSISWNTGGWTYSAFHFI